MQSFKKHKKGHVSEKVENHWLRLCTRRQGRRQKSFQWEPIRIERVLTTIKGRIFEIWEVYESVWKSREGMPPICPLSLADAHARRARSHESFLTAASCTIRSVDKFKQRTNVPYRYQQCYEKGVPYQRTIPVAYITKKTYRVSPIMRPTRKIRPSVIFEDDFNVSPSLKICPSWERQKDERVKHSFFIFIQTALMRCMPSFSNRKCLLHRPGFGHQIAGAPNGVFRIDSV